MQEIQQFCEKSLMIEKIYHHEQLLSVIIRRDFEKDGIEFFTPDTFSQQIGYMKRPGNYVIPPHAHNAVHRDVHFTQEVLLSSLERLELISTMTTKSISNHVFYSQVMLFC